MLVKGDRGPEESKNSVNVGVLGAFEREMDDIGYMAMRATDYAGKSINDATSKIMNVVIPDSAVSNNPSSTENLAGSTNEDPGYTFSKAKEIASSTLDSGKDRIKNGVVTAANSADTNLKSIFSQDDSFVGSLRHKIHDIGAIAKQGTEYAEQLMSDEVGKLFKPISHHTTIDTLDRDISNDSVVGANQSQNFERVINDTATVVPQKLKEYEQNAAAVSQKAARSSQDKYKNIAGAVVDVIKSSNSLNVAPETTNPAIQSASGEPSNSEKFDNNMNQMAKNIKDSTESAVLGFISTAQDGLDYFKKSDTDSQNMDHQSTQHPIQNNTGDAQISLITPEKRVSINKTEAEKRTENLSESVAIASEKVKGKITQNTRQQNNKTTDKEAQLHAHCDTIGTQSNSALIQGLEQYADNRIKILEGSEYDLNQKSKILGTEITKNMSDGIADARNQINEAVNSAKEHVASVSRKF